MITIKGIIETAYVKDYFTSIVIVQSDGYKIDLLNRMEEYVFNYGKKVTIRYWIASRKESDAKVKKGFLHKLMGNINIEFEKEDYQYSEYTSGTDYNTIFDISGHSLYGELLGQQGKYLILEIDFADQAKKSK